MTVSLIYVDDTPLEASKSMAIAIRFWICLGRRESSFSALFFKMMVCIHGLNVFRANFFPVN